MSLRFIGNANRVNKVISANKQAIGNKRYGALGGNGKLFLDYLSLSKLNYTRDSESYILYNGKLTHFPQLNQIAKRYIGGVPFVQCEDELTNLIPTNLLDPNWTRSAIETPTITNNPFGELGAWKIIPDAVSGAHGAYATFTPELSKQYCLSFVVNGNDYDWCRLTFGPAAFPGTPSCYFDLLTGVVGTAVSCDSYDIKSCGNGWYLVWIVATCDVATSVSGWIRVAEDDEDDSFSGNSSDSLIVWAPQVEQSAFPSSRVMATNLITYSDRYDNGTTDWYNDYCAIATKATEAPNIFPDQLADKVEEITTGDLSHGVYKNIDYITGVQYTISVYAKKGEREFLYIKFPNSAFGSHNNYAFYNLTTGVVGSTGGDEDRTAINRIGTSDWFRIELTATATATASAKTSLYACAVDGDNAQNGVEGYGLFLYRVQCEMGGVASYPQVTSATLGRSPTDAYWNASDVPTWLQNGFEIRATPYCSSTEYGTVYRKLFEFDTGACKLNIITSPSLLLKLIQGANEIVSSTVSWERFADLRIKIYPSAGKMILSGFATGNGEYNGDVITIPTGLDFMLGSTYDYNDFWGGLVSPPIRL